MDDQKNKPENTPANPIVQPGTTISSTKPQPTTENTINPEPVGYPIVENKPVGTLVTSTEQPKLKKPRFSKKVKLLAIGLFGIALLAGTSAGAYLGYIVPNKPDNIVKAALANFASQNEIKAKGTMDASGGGQPGYAMDYNLQVNRQQMQASFDGTLGIGGTQYTYDVRLVDKNLYAKVGGLSSLAPILGTSQFTSGIADNLKSVDNQWFVVDRSFWQTFSSNSSEDGNCIENIGLVFSDADMEKIKAAYENHPLFTVISGESADVDGVATTKYLVDPASDADAKAFVNELKNTDFYKQATSCAEDNGVNAGDEEISANVEETSSSVSDVALYITSDKTLKKLEISGIEEGTTGKFSATFDYSSVNIEKPEGAKPLQDLFSIFFSAFAQNMPTSFQGIEQ